MRTIVLNLLKALSTVRSTSLSVFTAEVNCSVHFSASVNLTRLPAAFREPSSWMSRKNAPADCLASRPSPDISVSSAHHGAVRDRAPGEDSRAERTAESCLFLLASSGFPTTSISRFHWTSITRTLLRRAMLSSPVMRQRAENGPKPHWTFCIHVHAKRRLVAFF